MAAQETLFNVGDEVPTYHYHRSCRAISIGTLPWLHAETVELLSHTRLCQVELCAWPYHW
jgi:hypothetical protein